MCSVYLVIYSGLERFLRPRCSHASATPRRPTVVRTDCSWPSRCGVLAYSPLLCDLRRLIGHTGSCGDGGAVGGSPCVQQLFVPSREMRRALKTIKFSYEECQSRGELRQFNVLLCGVPLLRYLKADMEHAMKIKEDLWFGISRHYL